MRRKYNVHVHYPLPLRSEVDVELRKLGGWYASGSDYKIRDHAIDCNMKELGVVLKLLPKDGYMTIRHKKKE